MNDKIGLRAHCSYLNDGALTDCVRRCLGNPGYRAGIFVTNNEAKERILEEFNTGVFRFFNNKIKKSSIDSRGASHILFENSSYILINKVVFGARGARLNEILVDEKVSTETIDAILYPFLINYDPLSMADYRQHQIQQEVDILFASKDVVPQPLSYEQNDGFINDNFSGVEENNELDEFINSFKINNNT